MPYAINKTNGTLISTVQDGTIDAKSLDIVLVGKNYSGYGEIFNENFVGILENFSNKNSPTKPLTGQLWYDSSNRTLKVYTGVPGTLWKPLGVITNSDSKPAGGNAGDLWWKTTEQRLYAYSGSGQTWTLVGPLSSKAGTSGALVSTVLRATAGSDDVVKIVSDNDEVAIFSNIDNSTNGGTNTNDPSYNATGGGYPIIKKGITLPALTLGRTDGVSFVPPSSNPGDPGGVYGAGFVLWGTAASATGLVGTSGTLHSADEYLLTAALASLNNKINVANDSGVLIGVQGVEALHITDSTVANITNVTGNALRFNVGTSNSTSTNGGSFYNIFYITTGTNNRGYILPNSTATSYIGTSTQRFTYAYVNTLTATNVFDNGNRVVTSVTLNAGTGISGGGTISGPSGTLAFTNTGILSITGTANQVSVSAGQNPTLSLPQSIDTAATVTFDRVNANSLYDNSSRVITAGTIASNAVTSLAGTTNQVNVSASQGSVTLSLPQSIHTGATPTFSDLTLTNLRATTTNGTGAKVYGTWTLAAGATFQASYADLAERYAADTDYAAGTVLIIGGSHEVTVTTQRADTARAGIVSTNPAYTLNAGAGDDSTHPYIALVGRVPCYVTGSVKKGNLLVTSSKPGHAEAAKPGDDPNSVIARALENFEGDSGVIEVMVI